MNANTCIFIINLIVLVAMGIGFLRGMVGLKFTLVRFIFFLLALGLSLLTMDLIANLLANGKFIFGRSLTSILVDIINDNQFIAGMYEGNQRVREVIDQLPYVLLQTLSFTISLIIFLILTNIAYIIVKKLVLVNIDWFDCGKRSKEDKLKNKVSLRSRIFGGLMGMIFSFVVFITVMMPISGILGTVGDVLGVNDTVSAEESTQEKSVEEKIFGKSFLVAKDYIKAYNNSSIGVISGIGGLDRAFVRRITVLKVDGKNVNLIDSIENMKAVYQDVLYVTDFAIEFESAESFDNLDLEKVKNLIDYGFNNELFDSLFDEIFVYSFDYLRDTVKADTDIKAYLDKIYEEMEKDESPKHFVKTELFNCIDFCQVLLNSKIASNVAEIIQNTENKDEAITMLIEKLLANDTNNQSYLKNAIAEFDDSKVANITVSFAYNKVLEILETSMMSKNDTLQKGFLGRVSLDTVCNFNQIGGLVDKATKLWKDLGNTEITGENMIYNILTKKNQNNEQVSKILVNGVFDVFEYVLSMDLVNYQVAENETILDRVIANASNNDLLGLINWEYIEEENIFSTEKQNLIDILDILYNSQNFEQMTNENFDKSKTLEYVLKILNEENDGVKNTKTFVTKLLSTKLFRNFEQNILTTTLTSINNSISTALNLSGKESTLIFTNMYQAQEVEDLASFAENFVSYYCTSLVDKTGDVLYDVVKSDYVQMAGVLESMKQVELFGDLQQGFYYDLMTSLDTAYGDYLDFGLATKDTFSWTTTMETYGEHLNNLLNHELVDNGETVIFFDVVKGSTSLEMIDALNQMGMANVVSYYENIKDCELLKPLSAIMLEEITKSMLP
ncbi:MAG: hypothetical protein IJW82_06730 [Clostridia bacterium]|nr:hypothetical protein [Clostridia bacterium]